MKHPLFVGHFEPPASTLQVGRPLSVGDLRPLLMQACDRNADGSPGLTNDVADSVTSAPLPICRIDGEDVFLKNGYLICPWLGIGFNKRSVSLVSRLCRELGCRIYEPGDGVFYEPEQLHSLEEGFYRSKAASSAR